MRLLVDILHPAHVHMFRNLSSELRSRGHEVVFALRDKDCAKDLLDEYGLAYQVLSQKQTGLGLAGEFVQRGVKLWNQAAAFRPHFLAGVMGPSIATVGRLRRALGQDRARVAVFYGTEIATLTNSFVYPLADYVVTPDSYQGRVFGRHITYPGYHELAYLHPARFKPDAEVVRRAGVDPSSPYFVVRFVSYEASHDVGANTLPNESKLALVRMLAERGRVLISSEGKLPAELESYRLRAPVSDIHHFLAFARMVVGESATVASEAVVLGVPAAYISPYSRGFIDDEARFGLVKVFVGERVRSDWVGEIAAWLSDPNLSQQVAEGHARLLREKVDVTAWMLSFFERELLRHFGEKL